MNLDAPSRGLLHILPPVLHGLLIHPAVILFSLELLSPLSRSLASLTYLRRIRKRQVLLVILGRLMLPNEKPDPLFIVRDLHKLLQIALTGPNQGNGDSPHHKFAFPERLGHIEADWTAFGLL